jgi:hypothetical protein
MTCSYTAPRVITFTSAAEAGYMVCSYTAVFVIFVSIAELG